MANKQKGQAWPTLQARWGGEQLIKRHQRGETTINHDTERLLDWMNMVIHAATAEYTRREELAQQVAELTQQLEAMKQRIEQLEKELE